ncbi:MAG: hypothetical protein RJA74_43 [Pseudomonadota bacterium]|jgi:hypothetical protein
MLSQQFFTRIQVSKLMGFKSDGMIKDFEKRGFLKPDIRPSKYSIIQVFFLFFCKELVEYTSFSWKELIGENFNEISQDDLYKKSFAYFFTLNDIIFETIGYGDDIAIINPGNITFVMFDNDVLNKQFNDMFGTINDIKKIDDFMTILIIPMKNGNNTIGVSLRRLKQKFVIKCQELDIDLTEKIPA